MGAARRETVAGRLLRSCLYAGVGAAVSAAEKVSTASDWAARRRRFAPARVRAGGGQVEPTTEEGAGLDPVLVFVGGAFVAGVVLAKWIAWKGGARDD